MMGTATPITKSVPEAENKRDSIQSRWGFHPCTYDYYKKLKDLNKVYIRERNAFHSLCRQLRKAPRHRTTAANCISTAMSLESMFITLYSESVRGTDSWGGSWWYRSMLSTAKYENGYTKRYPAKFNDLQIPVLYRLAKYPNAMPVPIPFSRGVLDRIDRLYRALTD